MKIKDWLRAIFFSGAVLVIIECGKDDDDSDDSDDSKYDDDDDGRPHYCPEENGLFPNKFDCATFYTCNEGQAILQTCAPGLLFDPKTKMCTFPNRVKCKNLCQSPNGLFPSNHRCDEFVLCTDNKPEVKRCKKGLWFDRNLLVCNFKSRVLCNLPSTYKKKKGTTTTPKPKKKSKKQKYEDDDEDDDGSYKPKDDEGQYYKPKGKKVRVGQYVSGANLFTVHGASLKQGHLELAAASVRSVCPKPRGLFAHADNCAMFYQCYDGEVLMKTCPAGLLFDSYGSLCAQGRDVDCGERRVYPEHSDGPPPPPPPPYKAAA